ncbi:P-loop containing nucleoside triphosphate hydrolase protein [Terfezia claveryi]|nr:P-loop containing nucleoside triphosphate hydrolase protein [Terfezia claveryi]
MALDPHLFTQTQLSLLATERTSDLLQSTSLITSIPPAVLAKQHGLAILNLSIISQRTGLGGKIILGLEKDAAAGGPGRAEKGVGRGGGGGWQEHTLRTGDVVRVEEMPTSGSAKKREKVEFGKRGLQGVVVRVDGVTVVVAVENRKSGVDGLLQVASGRLWVFKVANDATFIRMEKAMVTLQNLHEKSSLSHLHRVLLGIDYPLTVSPSDEQKVVESFFDGNLNPSQKSAVRFALASPDIALIHGPPGTGKTQTLIEVLQQLVRVQGKRVLVCGPSNISVDNILLRLPPDIPAVRVGHPARLLPGVVARSLDVLVRTSEAAEIVGDVRKELDEKMKVMAATGKKRIRGSERKEGWREVRELRGEYRRREEGAVRGLVRGSKVVVATLHGASGDGGRWLRGERFDVMVIDEGSQALEAQCWGAMLHGSEMGSTAGKLIIAGDHLQLPPTVKSENEKPKDDEKSDSVKKPPSLAKTTPLPKPAAELKKLNIPTTLSLPMFTRLLNTHGEGIKRLLTTQYRMHETIMTFPSKAFYGGKLIAHDSVRGHLLKDLPGVEDTEDTHYPIIFLDTQGGDFPESETGADVKSPGIATESKSNPGEILICVAHVRRLLLAGVKGSSIAVITPYSAQLSLLVAAFSLAAGSSTGKEAKEWGNVELSSIDGFQGREKDVVVISLVRSNETGEIGFLREGRRMNVAVTRPRRCLVVIGDGETLGGRGGGGRGGGAVKAGTKKVNGEGGLGDEMEEGEFVWRWIGWLEEAEIGVDVRYPSLEEAVSEAAEVGVR